MQIQKISDYGTSNPIVARLSLQTTEMMNLTELTKQQKDDVFRVFFSNIQPKLMACYRIKEKLEKEVRNHQKK